MQKPVQNKEFSDLRQIRERGTYSSTNLIRGSMINEMFVILYLSTIHLSIRIIKKQKGS